MLQNIVSSRLDGKCPGISAEDYEINLVGIWGGYTCYDWAFYRVLKV